MKSAPFIYHRVSDKAKALRLLSSLEGARLIAGGQSLVAMLNMRYAFVDNLIDINPVADLAAIEIIDDMARIGAMTRQRAILEHPLLAERAPVIAEALRFVGHVHTRNRGTIGGSLAHMDPAAELVAIAKLLDATVHVESVRGRRDVPIADFVLSFMTTALEVDEMIVAVSLKMPPQGHGWSFDEFALRHGDFAIAAVGIVLNLAASGDVADVRIVLSGLDFAPQRLTEAEHLLMGRRPTEAAIAEAADLAGEGDAISDALASGAYRRRVAKTLTARGLARALARASSGSVQ